MMLYSKILSLSLSIYFTDKVLGTLNTMSMRLLRIPCQYALIFLGVICLCLPASAQSNWAPTRYYGIPKAEKRIEFYDEFVDNRYNWNLSNPQLQTSIDDDLYCASHSKRPLGVFQLVPINQSGNYEIELRMRFVRGNSRSATGLAFGGDNRGNAFHFVFMPEEKQFKIFKQDKSRDAGESIQDWQSNPNIQYYPNNTLTVRKIGGSWYFFINQEFVGQKPARELYGNDFGFTIGGDMAVEVDYLKVYQIRTIDTNGPNIELLQPQLNGDTPVGSFYESKQIIKGYIKDESEIHHVLINNTPITLESDGTFTASVMLPRGRTRIEIVAVDVYRNTTHRNFFMQYSDPYQSNLDALRDEPYQPSSRGGKNYLLLIGINDYDYWSNLHNPVKDCGDIATELINNYQFEKENVIRLTNHKATRENILEAFENIQTKITDEDNLLIYYAGHGYYDDESGRGYWVPSDARLSKISDFIRNSTIHDYMKSINSHHTFLIADACYAGSLFSQSRSVIRESARSRWAFTSGDIEKVWDGQPGQNSPFAKSLLKALRQNRSSKLRADRLIDEVITVVKRNTSQTPMGLPLKEAGDEGGVFVFLRKSYAGR